MEGVEGQTKNNDDGHVKIHTLFLIGQMRFHHLLLLLLLIIITGGKTNLKIK